MTVVDDEMRGTITEIRDRLTSMEVMLKQAITVGKDHETRIRKIEGKLAFVRNAWAVWIALIAAIAATIGAWIQSRFK